MSRDIIVLGSMNVDFVVRVKRRPGIGETVPGSEFSIFPGGKGANQAVAAARLGGNVAMAGRIGDDVFSKVVLDSLSSAGVGRELIVTTQDVPTGSAFITVDETGENSIVVVPGANGHCSKADVDALRPHLELAKMLMLQRDTSGNCGACSQRCQILRHEGNVGPGPACTPVTRVAQGHRCTPNEHEASFLTGRKVTDAAGAQLAASDLLKAGARAVVIKLGSGGLVWAEGGKSGVIPGHRVHAVDTTAAGDAFSGGLAAALCEGKSLEEACRFANAVGALSVTRKGAQTSMPERREVEVFLQT